VRLLVEYTRKIVPLQRKNRGVAQLASAPRSGRGGRKFESSHPDYKKPANEQFAGFLLQRFVIKHYCSRKAAKSRNCSKTSKRESAVIADFIDTSEQSKGSVLAGMAFDFFSKKTNKK
jgi:hypothetical protein